MDFDTRILGAIRDAIEVQSYLGDDGALARDAADAAMGIASVLEEDATPDGLAGASWRDADGKANSLLVSAGVKVHAIVAGNSVEVTSYASGIDTLRAEDFHKLGQVVTEGWRVMKWHLTLRDGSVITLRAENGQHSDELAIFVRSYLLPTRSL